MEDFHNGADHYSLEINLDPTWVVAILRLRKNGIAATIASAEREASLNRFPLRLMVNLGLGTAQYLRCCPNGCVCSPSGALHMHKIRNFENLSHVCVRLTDTIVFKYVIMIKLLDG